MKLPPITSFKKSVISVTFKMGTLLPFGTLGSTIIKTNLFWVVPRQLTQFVPTFKVTLINHSKQRCSGAI
jgi:hypothetical protein